MKLVLFVSLFFSITTFAQDRLVVFHKSGPAWNKNVGPFEQEKLSEHVTHYKKLFAEGKGSMGGPFPLVTVKEDGTIVGMMITEAGLTRAELEDFAAKDPWVLAGMVTPEIHDWFAGMTNTPNCPQVKK